MFKNDDANDVFNYNGYHKKFKELVQFPLNDQRTVFISEFLQRPGVFSVAVGIPLPGTNRHHMLKSSMVTDVAGMYRLADNIRMVADQYTENIDSTQEQDESETYFGEIDGQEEF